MTLDSITLGSMHIWGQAGGWAGRRVVEERQLQTNMPAQQDGSAVQPSATDQHTLPDHAGSHASSRPAPGCYLGVVVERHQRPVGHCTRHVPARGQGEEQRAADRGQLVEHSGWGLTPRATHASVKLSSQSGRQAMAMRGVLSESTHRRYAAGLGTAMWHMVPGTHLPFFSSCFTTRSSAAVALNSLRGGVRMSGSAHAGRTALLASQHAAALAGTLS